ncbi:retrovirus-related pol polyprotein from transposon TNT 1-94 [Tanacetum coccineum]
MIDRKRIPEVIVPNKQNVPHNKEHKEFLDSPNTKGTNGETHGALVPYIKASPLNTSQSPIIHQASSSSYYNTHPQYRWSRDQHIQLVNIIGDPSKGMLTRSIADKLTSASASECLFADLISWTELKKVSLALKHPGWVDAMQEQLNKFHKNKVWTLVLAPRGKTIISSKWGYRQEEGSDYDETFGPVARLEAIRILLACTTYMNFIVYQMDVKSAFLNGPLWTEISTKGLQTEKGISICQEKYIRDLLKKYEISYSASVKTPMVPPTNLGLDLYDKSASETLYRGMIGSLMYLTASMPDIQFSTCLCVRYQANPKESHLIAIKRIFMYLKGTPTLGLWYDKCSGFDLEGIQTQTMLDATWTEKAHQVPINYLVENWFVRVQRNNSPISFKGVMVYIYSHLLYGSGYRLHFIPTAYQLADIFTIPLDKPTFTRLKAEPSMLNIDQLHHVPET